MHFSENDIERFAAWSGDHNPLHVDPEFAQGAGYKQPVVHGVLLAIGALGSVRSRPAARLKSLEIEFHSAVHPNAACDMEAVLRPDDLSISLRQGDAEVAFLLGEFGTKARPDEVDLSWTRLLEAGLETQQFGKRGATQHDFSDLRSGIESTGVYATDPPPEAATSSGLITPIQARVLGLCSYLSGMELPGARSLLTRLSLQFAPLEVDENVLWYRARVVRLDGQSRILDTRLEVSTPEGRLVATGEWQSYVRFIPLVIDLESLAARVTRDGTDLAGKVALVCGASRGLGADLTAALALAGCRVYANYKSGTAAAEQLEKRLAERGLPIEFLQGNAGDPAWCQSAFDTIRARHGRLDILTLNACAPPTAFRLTPDKLVQFEQYLNANLRLACAPLATFLPLLDASHGTIVCSSSSFVTDPQPGLAHYAALKQAVEGAVCSALRETSNVDGIIVRAPRLLTSWNDSPARARDAIPADWVAARIVDRLAGQWRPGRVEILSQFSAPGPEQDRPSAPEENCLVVETEPVIATPVEATHPAEIELEDPVEVEAAHPVNAEPVRLIDAAASTLPVEEYIRPLEHVENRKLDPDNVLVAIDALIAEELDRVPAASFDSDCFLADHNDRPLLPVLTETTSWHEAQGVPASDSANPGSLIIDAPVSSDESAAHDRPEFEGCVPELTVEQRLDELLDVLQIEADEMNAIPNPDEVSLDETFHEMGIGSDFDHVETEISLPVPPVEVPPETAFVVAAEESHPDAGESQTPAAEPADTILQVAVTTEALTAAEEPAVSEALPAENERTALESPIAAETLPEPVEPPVVDDSAGSEAPTAAETSAPPEFLAVVDEPANENAKSRSEAALSPEDVERHEAVVYSARAEPIEITGYTSDTESDLYEFHQQAFPGERKDRFISRWLWKHVESARRLAIEPRVWLCRQRGAVVAHNGAIPIKLKIGDEEQLVAWIGETASIDTYRHEDIGFRLLSQASEELPFCLSVGQSERTRTALLQMGWVQVAPLTIAQFVIHPEAVQHGKLSGTAALAAGWGSRVTSAVRTLLNHRPTMEIQQVTRFDDRHDRLWQMAARDITCGVIRDAAYLNWKYVDPPGQDILRLELIEQETVRGVVILNFCEANDDYPYRHAYLVDLVSPLSDERLLQQLVQIASTAAAERNTDALLFQHVCQPLTRILRQNGFRMYEPDQFLLVNPRQLPLESRVKVLAGKDWFVTPGDAEFCV